MSQRKNNNPTNFPLLGQFYSSQIQWILINRNKERFYANSAGGKIEITHNTIIDMFHNNSYGIKCFLLPMLKSFHATLGNDSLKQIKAVIFTAENYMLINEKIKVKIKQQISQYVNNINIRNAHMTCQQKTDLDIKVKKTTSLIAEIQTEKENPVYSRYYRTPSI